MLSAHWTCFPPRQCEVLQLLAEGYTAKEVVARLKISPRMLGAKGTVQDVQILTTTLHTVDNLRLTVPNAKITEGIITNYSVTPTRRIQLTVGVSYDDDLQQVQQVLEALIAEEPCILKEPAPFFGVSALGESSVDVVVQVWVQRADVRQVRFGLLEKIKLAFDQHGIRIPYP